MQPYYDTSLPFYGQVPVAKKASTKTLKRLASPLEHKVTPSQTEESPASTRPMWKVNTTPRVVVDKMTAFRLDSEDPDEKDGMSLIERQIILARKANATKTDAKPAGEADFAARLYAEAQQKKLNLEQKQKIAQEAQLQEEAELCSQFKAQPIPGKQGGAGTSTTPVEVRLSVWLQSKKEQEEATKRKKEEEFAEVHSFAPKLNTPKKAAAGTAAETTGTIYSRQKDWLSARAQKIAEKQEEKAKEEVEGLTFRPEISARAKRADMSELRAGSPVHDRLYRQAAETQQRHQGERDEMHLSARMRASGVQMKSLADQRDRSMRLYSPERTRQGAGRQRRTGSREDLSGSIRKV